MKKWLKISLQIVGGIIAAFVILIVLLFFILANDNGRENKNNVNQAEMKRITLEWARLAPFPKEAENFNIQTSGSSFTRSFKGSFNASIEIIQQWVEKSPGLQDAKIEIISDEKKKYIISPGGGAAYAEVIIDYGKGTIEFRAYWS